MTLSKNRYFTSIILILLCSTLSFGQNSRKDFSREVFLMSRNASPEIDAEGSPYVHEEFIPVRINDDDILYSGRFNAYNGEMEIVLEDKKNPIALDLRNDYVVKFVNNNKTYQSYNYKNEDDRMVNGFMVNVFDNGRYTLLAKESVRFQDKVSAKTSYQKDKKAKFIRDKDIYYLKLIDDSVIEVPRKNKDLADFFPDHKDKIKDFIKDEKINTKDKNDLIKFVKFVDAL